MADQRTFRCGVVSSFGLEGDRAGEQPSVDLGQRHIHCEIARAEPPSTAVPAFLVTAGTFAATTSLTSLRTQHAATRLENGAVLITGGTNSKTAVSSAEIY